MARKKSAKQLEREIAEALEARSVVMPGATTLSYVDPTAFKRHPFQDKASRTGRWTVVVEDGYVKVKRDGITIAAGIDAGGKRLRDIEFTRPEYRLSNPTRQKAMKALQEKGYH